MGRRGPEAKIQDKVIKWAKETYRKQIECKKNQAGRYGSNGWSDYEIFRAEHELLSGTRPAAVLFLEFKAPGAEATELQAMRLKRLREMGFATGLADSVELGQEIIKDFMDEGGW